VPKPKGNFRWIVIALAFIITLVNYLDRSAVSYAREALKLEFGLNERDYGLIAGAFGSGYMVMAFTGGLLVDRYGPRRIWAGAAIIWSGITAFLGFVSGLWPLICLRSALGLAEGPHFPALTRVVADWLPVNERARATAISLAAVPLASVIGAPLISQLIIHCGWRAMFMILGSLGIGWAILWVWIFRDLPQQSQAISEEEVNYIAAGNVEVLAFHHTAKVSALNSPPDTSLDERFEKSGHQTPQASSQKTSWKFLLTNPSLLANYYSFFCFGYLLYFSVNWLPGYLQKTYAVSLDEVGKLCMIPWAFSAVLLWVGGIISDRVWSRTKSIRKARAHIIWICQLLSAAYFAGLLFKPDLAMAMVMMSLGLGFGLMPNAAFYALNCDLARDRAGTCQGLMVMFSSGASMSAPILTGWLVDCSGNFNSSLCVLIFSAVTSSLVVFLFQKPDVDWQLRQQNMLDN
jgi:sugar phosphate permease